MGAPCTAQPLPHPWHASNDAALSPPLPPLFCCQIDVMTKVNLRFVQDDAGVLSRYISLRSVSFRRAEV